MDTPAPASAPAIAPGGTIHPRDKSLVGRVISDRYRIEALIAKGGMGAVYRGYHRYLKKRVAVKVLQPDLDGLPDLVARFEREAVAGAHVNHPNVAAATDFGKLDDGSYFLVVELVAGPTLSEIIRSTGRLSPPRAARIARQLASALDAVHALGIIHRDVKARNVMIAGGDTAKLIDFGLARVPIDRISSPRRSRLDSMPQRITSVGEIFGTVAYLPPEAALGMDAVDARSDLYSLGVLFYEMLAGRRPFGAVDPGDLFLEQQDGAPPFAVRAPHALVPPALEAVVMRLLERDPERRYQTGADVVAAIGAALADAEPSSVTTTATAMEQPTLIDAPVELPLRSARAPLLATAALVLALTIAVARLGGGPAPQVAAPPSAPSPSAVVAPAPTAEPAPPALAADPALRRDLVRTARARDPRAAARALLALVERDAVALGDAEVVAAARDVSMTLPADGSGDEVLEALGQHGGAAGLDVLYGLVERRGGSRLAARAAAILRRPGSVAAASPELRLAFALRDAPCVDKLALLDRAAREGDTRALLALETQGRACFTRNPSLDAAIAALRARLTPR